jgi:hypothetical protein
MPQFFTIGKAAGFVSINNLPDYELYGGSFTPIFDKLGDGAALVTSLTTDTCKVVSGVVRYVGAGICTLQASVAEGTNYLTATGTWQSFTIGGVTQSYRIFLPLMIR